MGDVLIVSFDGLDKELIEEYGLEHVQQEEFGTIDNDTGIKVRVTDELFASFLTGTTWDDHGVIGLKTYENPYLARFEDMFRKYWWFRKFAALRHRFYQEVPFLNGEKRGRYHDDIDGETFLDAVDDAVDIAVPCYSVGYEPDLLTVLDRHGIEAAAEAMQRFERCKEHELMDAIEEDHDLVFMHSHEADSVHHWFWEIGEEERVEETYHRIDEQARRIRDAAEDRYDLIIFFSDHGLPTANAHNENAFYSANQELFGDAIPHITEFHDKIHSKTEDEITQLDV
ncbi:MAG: alkaline phosphatase family protein [Candidatus Nanohaloarchaea archaeon]|nr:alkaline phosphatase family protein [Candidatus Nanohaloarchaea archaeon]